MSMSDRELLELAAKAAGYDVMRTVSGHLVVDFKKWNPLEDDGDALRLAVKLKLEIERSKFDNSAVYVGAPRYAKWREEANDENDIINATRRAIVRAAAEIGKSMQESK